MEAWEHRLDAARTLLASITREEDLARLLEPQAVRLIEDLTELLEAQHTDDGQVFEVRVRLGWLHWFRYLALPADQDEEDLQATLEMFLPIFLTASDIASLLPPNLLPMLAEEAVPLAVEIMDQAIRTADIDSYETAVRTWQRIAQATPTDDPARAGYLAGLGLTLLSRSERAGYMVDLDASIDAVRQAVDAATVHNLNQSAHLSLLGTALRSRFARTGNVADLDEAIRSGRLAIDDAPEGDPNRVGYLSSFGVTLLTRFERTGNMADLDASIDVGSQAVSATPIDHGARADYLSSLGEALLTRFEQTGNMADLDASIDAVRQAVDSATTDYPSRARMLSRLGTALSARFERTGNMADLASGIDAGRQAVDAIPVDHPSRADYLTDLGISFFARFKRAGDMADLNAGISSVRQAVDAAPVHYRGRAASLSTLGAGLFSRFERTGDLADLDASISAARQAVGATSADDLGRAGYLSNLGSGFFSRFERTREVADLDAGIDVARQAVDSTQTNHPNRGGRLSSLAVGLAMAFERTGDLDQLNEAIDAGREAVVTTPTSHPNRAIYLSNLGISLRTRFEVIGSRADEEDALAQFVEAADLPAAVPSIRVRACRAAALLCGSSNPRLGARLLETAVGLLPQIAGRQLGHGDQQHVLDELSGLAADAAALALADESLPEPDRAIRALRLLEAGRAVLFSQALDTRSDLTDLRDYGHAALANRYIELRDRLDQPPDRTEMDWNLPSWAHPDPHALAAQFEEVLGEIRTLPGFSSFARLPGTDDLLASAAAGPVVTLNVSIYRSDALLLTRDGITAVALPRLSNDTVVDQIITFHQSLNQAREATSFASRTAAQKALREVLTWLWEALAEPVLDALGYRHSATDGGWPRVWWAPGGLLGLLPIHAAGRYDQPGRGLAVIDRIISSYTPTIRARHHAHQQARSAGAALNSDANRSLIVAMPTTPDLPDPDRSILAPLPAAAEEAILLTSLLPNPVVLIEATTNTHRPIATDVSTDAATPTRAAVFEHLPHCAIAHFACHGTHNAFDPSTSCLLLHDHATAPLTVASLAPVRLGRAQLAYLSACRTAFQGTQLLDEAIHLSAAFQLAGFPHVIATLWEIPDKTAVSVANGFYTRLDLMNGNRVVDTGRAAHALHHTIRNLRDKYPNLPSLWAAYVHAGA